MNRLVIAIFALTVGALVWLGVVSFGPGGQSRQQGQVNPASMQATATAPIAVEQKPVLFDTFKNRDLKENFFSVAIPHDWTTRPGAKPGGYVLTFPGGHGTIELMDVPDNSTLQLFILSQEVPRLKRRLAGYQQHDFQKLTVDGQTAFRLTFAAAQDGGGTPLTRRTYVAGPDQAAVLTFAADATDDAVLAPLFSSVVDSFHWSVR
jgi:hypothetical protein